MKIIENEKGQEMKCFTVEKGEIDFEVDRLKSIHFYNKNNYCVGYVPNYIPNGHIKLECSYDVARVYIYSNGSFITLMDYRFISKIVIE